MAASHTKIDQNVSGGIPSYTAGRIHNSSKRTISLGGIYIWQGSQNADFPAAIFDRDVGEFTHSALSGDGDDPGSVVGLEYKVSDKIKLIIAWSNPLYGRNKVYTEILKQHVQWEQIKTNLTTRGEASHSTSNFGYTSEVNIDSNSNTPTLRAKIQLSGVKPTSQSQTQLSCAF